MSNAANVESVYSRFILDTGPYARAIQAILGMTDQATRSFEKFSNQGTKSFESTAKAALRGHESLANYSARLDELKKKFESVDVNSKRFDVLKKAVQETESRIQSLTSSTHQMGEAIKNNSSPSFFSSMLSNVKQLAVGALSVATIIATLSLGTNYEAQMSAVQAASGATRIEFDQLKTKARELGATTSFSANQAAQAMTEMSKAGFNTLQTLIATGDVLNLAMAGELGLAEATTLAADAMAGFGLQAEDVGMISDVLANAANASTIGVRDLGETFKYVAGVAKTAGIGINDVATMTAILGSAGVKGSMAGTTLKSMILSLSAPTKEASKALQSLGISGQFISKNLENPIEILQKMQGQMKNMSADKKLDFVATIFGREPAAGIIALMEKTKGEYVKLKEQIGKEGGALEFGKKMTDNLKGDLAGLSSAIEEMQLKVFDAIGPSLRMVVHFTTNLINGIGSAIDFFGPLAETLLGVKSGLLGILLVLTPLGIAWGLNALGASSFVGALGLMSSTMIPALIAKLALLKGALIAAMAPILANPVGLIFVGIGVAIAGLLVYINAVKARWDQFSDALIRSFQAMEPINNTFFKIQELVSVIANKIVGWFSETEAPEWLQEILWFASSIWEKIKETDVVLLALKIPIGYILAMFIAFNIALETGMEIAGGVYDIFKKISSLIPSISFSEMFAGISVAGLSASIAKVNQIMNPNSLSFWDEWTEKLSSWKSKFIQGFDIGSGIGEKLDGVKKSIQEFINNFINQLSNFINRTKQYFINLIPPEFRVSLNNALNTVTEFFKGLYDRIKNGWESITEYFKEESKKPGQAPGSEKKPSPSSGGLGGGSGQSIKIDKSDVIRTAQLLQQEFNNNPVVISAEANSVSAAKFVENTVKAMGLEFEKKGIKPNPNGGQIVDFEIKAKQGQVITDQQKAELERLKNFSPTLKVKYNNAEVIDGKKKELNINNEIFESVKKLGDSYKQFTEAKGVNNLISGLELAQTAIQSLGSKFTQLLQAQSELAKVKFDNFKQNLNFIGQGLAKLLEISSKNTLDAIDRETDAQKSKWDTELAGLEEQKKALLKIEEDFERDKALLKAQYDEESKKQVETEFQSRLALLQAEYDKKKETIESDVSDEQQRQQQLLALSQEFEDGKINLRATMDDLLLQKQNENQTKIQTNEDEIKAIKENKEKEIDDKKQLIESQKTAFLAEQENKRTRAQEEADRKKEASRKGLALIEWAAGRAAFEADKQGKMASVGMGLAQALMSAVQAVAAMTAATLGFGLPVALGIGALLSGMALATAMTARTTIQSMQYAPPPIFAAGGLIGGNLHSDGGSIIEAERGEFVVNRESTARNLGLLQNINSGGSTGEPTTKVFDFRGTQIIVNGSGNPLATADAIEKRLFDKIVSRLGAIK